MEEAAQAYLDSAPATTIAVFKAYAAGVNLAVDSMKFLPIEFHLTQVAWRPWNILDTAAFSVFMQVQPPDAKLSLELGWKRELPRARLIEALGQQAADGRDLHLTLSMGLLPGRPRRCHSKRSQRPVCAEAAGPRRVAH